MTNEENQDFYWDELNALVYGDKRFAIPMYLGCGISLLFIVLESFTGLVLFRWLTIVPMAEVIVLSIVAHIVTIRKRSQHRKRNEPKEQQVSM